MGNEIDSWEIAMTFNRNHFDGFQQYGILLHRETAEIAEAFYDAMIKLFYVKNEINRAGCTELLKELMDSSPSPARAKHTTNAFKSTPRAETMSNMTQEVLPKELTDAINIELNIQEPPIINERIFVPTLPKGLAARVKAQSSATNEPGIPTCSDTVYSRKETVVIPVNNESTYTELENAPDKHDLKSNNQVESNDSYSENAAFSNLRIKDSASESDKVGTSDVSDMKQSSVIMGAPAAHLKEYPVMTDAPAADLKEHDNAIETDSAKKLQSKETFYSLNECKNIIILNYFSLPSYEIAVHLYQKIFVEIGNLYGIYGLIIFVPGANKLYFASYTYIINGCIASSFHSNIDIFTTNISMLEYFLKPYNVEIKCKIHALNIYFRIKYMDKCSSIHPKNIIGHYNDLVIGDQTARHTAPDKLAKVIPFYYEIYQ